MQYVIATLIHFFTDLNFLPRFVSGQFRKIMAFAFELNISDWRLGLDSRVVLSLYNFKNVRYRQK